jgi:hypothetical protein
LLNAVFYPEKQYSSWLLGLEFLIAVVLIRISLSATDFHSVTLLGLFKILKFQKKFFSETAFNPLLALGRNILEDEFTKHQRRRRLLVQILGFLLPMDTFKQGPPKEWYINRSLGAVSCLQKTSIHSLLRMERNELSSYLTHEG